MDGAKTPDNSRAWMWMGHVGHRLGSGPPRFRNPPRTWMTAPRGLGVL